MKKLILLITVLTATLSTPAFSAEYAFNFKEDGKEARTIHFASKERCEEVYKKFKENELQFQMAGGEAPFIITPCFPDWR